MNQSYRIPDAGTILFDISAGREARVVETKHRLTDGLDNMEPADKVPWLPTCTRIRFHESKNRHKDQEYGRSKQALHGLRYHAVEHSRRLKCQEIVCVDVST